MVTPSTSGQWRFAALAPLAALVGLLYCPSLAELATIWSNDPSYSHGFLVPVFSVVLAWAAGRAAGGPCVAQISTTDIALGILKVSFGLALHLAALLLGQVFLDVAALVCMVRGIVLVLGGTAAHQRFGLAAIFLIFMARLPITWNQAMARQLQSIVCASSAACFELCGIPVYREGFQLHLPGHTLQVGEACSGIRQLMAVLALAVVIGYLFTRRKEHLVVLVVAGIPAAIVANCLRVIVSGLALRWLGPNVANGVLHTLEGLVTMALVSVLLTALAWVLSRRRESSAARPPPSTCRKGLQPCP